MLKTPNRAQILTSLPIVAVMLGALTAIETEPFSTKALAGAMFFALAALECTIVLNQRNFAIWIESEGPIITLLFVLLLAVSSTWPTSTPWLRFAMCLGVLIAACFVNWIVFREAKRARARDWLRRVQSSEPHAPRDDSTSSQGERRWY